MTFVSTPDTIRVAMQGAVNGNEQVFTLWFHGVGPATESDLENLADALENWWTTNGKPISSADFEMQSIYLIAQDALDAPSHLHSYVTPEHGTVASAVVSPQTAPVVKFETANRGRSGRGRNYVPGCPLVSLVTPGVLSTGGVTAYIDLYTALNPAIAGLSLTHVVVSFQIDHAARAHGFPQAVVGYSVVTPSLGTQRRRRIGIGA